MSADAGGVVLVSDMRFRVDDGALLSEAQLTGAMKALIADPRTLALTLVGRPLRDGHSRPYELPLPAHVTVAELPDWSRLRALARLPALARAVRRVVRRTAGRGHHLVVFMPTLAGVLAIAAARLARRRPRLVVVVRGSLTETLRLQPGIAGSRSLLLAVAAFGWVARRLVATGDSVVCVSASLASEVGVPDAVIAPEVDWDELRRHKAAGGERHGVLYLGRLEPEKGVDVVVEAAAGGRGGDPLPLTVIGGGSLGPDLQRRVEDAGAGRVVRFTGPLDRDAVLRHLGLAKVLVVPSRAEGFGLAALEGAVFGARVLYAPVGGLPEALAWTRSAVPVSGHDRRVWRRSMEQALALPAAPLAPEPEDVRTAMGWSRLEDVVFGGDDGHGTGPSEP